MTTTPPHRVWASGRYWLSMRGIGIGLPIASIAMLVVLNARGSEARQVVYVPAASLEAEWGRLVAVTNITMHSRRDGSDRIGFFRTDNGTLWGLPLATPGSDRAVLGCAPAELRGARITDSLPADVVEILGASDFFASAFDGTSGVPLLVRIASGTLRWQRVVGTEHVSSTGTTCREPSMSGRHRDPLARYHYFRIASAIAR